MHSSGPAEAAPDSRAEDLTDRFLIAVSNRCRGAGESWTVAEDASGFWIGVDVAGVEIPDQGWKLHVSAGLSSADEVLQGVLDVMVTDPTPFKVARSPAHLDALNWGAAGLSQVGKFVTIYPTDDAQAVRLALALHQATLGLRGPRVPSDQPLLPGSLVHRRYGSFAQRFARLASGELAPVIRAPDGELVADRRTPMPPDWVDDPFPLLEVGTAPGSGPALAPMADSTVVGGRFLLMGSLHQTARGGVYLAVDLEHPRRCIVKQARRDALLSSAGSDARDRLRAEARTLEVLGPQGPWPECLALIDAGDDVFLVEEEIVGDNLARRIVAAAAWGRHLPPTTVAAWGAQLARALERIHAAGLVVGDLKAANVVVTGNDIRLIDLECVAAGIQVPGGSLATRGSASPQQIAGHPPSPTDDVFGLGALLWFMATGADPGAAPNPGSLLERSTAALNPAVPALLDRVIARALEPDPNHRFATAALVADALESGVIEREVIETGAPLGHRPESTTAPPAPPDFTALARAVGHAIRARAIRLPSGDLSWKGRGGPVVIDLAQGDAAAVLTLSALHAAAADDDLAETIVAGAWGLVHAPRLADPPMAGLYIGDGGVAAALLAAGRAIGDQGLLDAAFARGASLADLAFGATDLINGSAGRARTHLWLHQCSGSSQCLDDAVAAGEHLLACAESDSSGTWWTMPVGFGALSGRRDIGYAHGAAGIADVLLDLYQASGQDRFLRTAQDAVRWIIAQAVPALDDDSGATWPISAGEPEGMIAWCNGSAGVGSMLLHAAALGVHPDADELARRAARAVAGGTRALGPNRCHGLAGSVEYLLDTARATGDRTFADQAAQLGALLATFVPAEIMVDEAAAGGHALLARLVLPIGYLEGLTGVLAALLRLARPADATDLLGGRWPE